MRRIKDEDRVASRTFSCDARLWKLITEAAYNEKVTLSKWIVNALKKELNKETNANE